MEKVKYRASVVGVFLWFFLFFSLNEGKQTPLGSLLLVLLAAVMQNWVVFIWVAFFGVCGRRRRT
jgi:hypothetical protein